MVPTFRLIGPPEPAFAWDGARLVEGVPAQAPQEGAFAGLADGVDDGAARLARDPLGLGKLFWATAGDGTVELAARPARLTDRGHPLGACAAVPADTLVTYRPGAASPEITPLTGTPADGDGGGSVEAIAAEIRDVTARYVQAVLAARPGPVVVCLSGGLDSTSVAALVREHRDDAVAVTFDLASPGRARQRSDDFVAAEAAARHLGLDLVPAVFAVERLFELLDTVLVAGIDWRDFNVHAGLVNAALALAIAELVGDRRGDSTVFTGDLVNELVADYHSETYKGRTYYRLPRLPIARTRDALVRGLASSHREVGVFAELGLTVVQPYAVARRQFLRLPDDVLGPGPGKARLYRAMFGDTLPRSCYGRPKTRAQTGSETGGRGVLGACADAGLDERHLASRFARLHGLDDPAALGRFLRAGRYRTAVPLT
jgi:asparagine synthetase B (glutamine-hydrolysing)